MRPYRLFLSHITIGAMLRFLLFFAPAALLVGQNQPSPAGDWVSNLKYFENDNFDRLHLELNGSKLVGKLGDDAFNGTFTGGRIEGTVNSGPKQTIKLTGSLKGDRIEGTARLAEERLDLKWEAYRQTSKRTASPKRHTFEPGEFQHHFSADIKPVLRLNPGDSVRTWSVDAGGTDSKGVRRTSGGNPLTGPFYIEGTVPGDTLVIHFTRIRLNRNSAISSPLIVNSALDPDYVEERKKIENYDADWKLDLKNGFASLQKPTDMMKNYRVPIAPMLGCVGVAPGGGNRYRSGYLGRFGGNLDYNQLREGVTVYLPVNVLGALLFVGDGHAVQGAGELTGNALETSMDIEFSVDYLPGWRTRAISWQAASQGVSMTPFARQPRIWFSGSKRLTNSTPPRHHLLLAPQLCTTSPRLSILRLTWSPEFQNRPSRPSNENSPGSELTGPSPRACCPELSTKKRRSGVPS
jgi:amidase